MFKDSQLIMTFQLSLIGIILIGGLFLIWKAISRIEEKIDQLSTQKECNAFNNFKHQLDAAFAPPMSEKEIQESMSKDPLMKDLFSPDMKEDFVMFTCPINLSSVVEEKEKKPDETVKIEEVEKEPSEAMSETLSKSKLRSMNLDKLKKLCEEKNLSTEGTKNQLIDRILQE